MVRSRHVCQTRRTVFATPARSGYVTEGIEWLTLVHEVTDAGRLVVLLTVIYR